MGKIVLDGCSIKFEAPNYRCVNYNYEWKRGKPKNGNNVDEY